MTEYIVLHQQEDGAYRPLPEPYEAGSAEQARRRASQDLKAQGVDAPVLAVVTKRSWRPARVRGRWVAEVTPLEEEAAATVPAQGTPAEAEPGPPPGPAQATPDGGQQQLPTDDDVPLTQ